LLVECVSPTRYSPLMRLAALYDIHGNLEALEAVLADVRRANVDRIVVGGDVMPGGDSAKALRMLRGCDLRTDFIYGNGEVAVLAEHDHPGSAQVPESVRPSLRAAAGDLGAEERRWLRTWPKTVSLDMPKFGRVLFCHATPRDENELFLAEAPESELLPKLQGVTAQVIVCGHTHIPFDRKVGPYRVVNPGSVGLPFNAPGIYWALLADEIVLRRTDLHPT